MALTSRMHQGQAVTWAAKAADTGRPPIHEALGVRNQMPPGGGGVWPCSPGSWRPFSGAKNGDSPVSLGGLARLRQSRFSFLYVFPETFEIGAQGALGAYHARFHCAYGHIENLGDLGVGQVLEAPQHENLALMLRKMP